MSRWLVWFATVPPLTSAPSSASPVAPAIANAVFVLTGQRIRHFDGETITLMPSIGNWELPCRSHYYIWKDTAEWASRYSEDEIAEAIAEASADSVAGGERFLPCGRLGRGPSCGTRRSGLPAIATA
jgi:hypothetical protein